MDDRSRRRGRAVRRQRRAVEPVLQDRIDVPVRAGADGQCPGAGGFQPVGAISPPEAEEPQAGPVALLRVGPGRQDRLNELGGLGADLGGPGDEPGGTPLPVPLVGFLSRGIQFSPGMGIENSPAVARLVGTYALASVPFRRPALSFSFSR